MFWYVVLAVLAVLVIVFFDVVREYPLGATLLVSAGVYFVWRAYSFLTGDMHHDTLVWKILGSTALVMIVVAGVGSFISRRASKKK